MPLQHSTPRARRAIHRHACQFTALFLAVAATGCGAELLDSEGADLHENAPTGEVSQAAIVSGQTACSLINKAKLSTGNFTLTPTCSAFGDNEQNDVWYNGSSRNDLSAFISRPKLMTDAHYCAMAETHGQSVESAFSTKVGKFGVAARMNISSRNNGARQLEGQRVGKVFLFGVGADLDVQNFVWSSKQELRRASLIPAIKPNGTRYTQEVGEQLGYYNMLDKTGMAYGIATSGTFPIVGPFTLTVSGGFDQKWNYATRGNNLVSLAPKPEFAYTLAEFFCANGGGCPTAEEVRGHERLCGAVPGRACTPADYYSEASGANPFGDNLIPYDGLTGGAGGSFLYRNTIDNWTHFGRTGADPSRVTSGEPVWKLSASDDNSYNTRFNVGLDFGFDLGFLTLGVGVKPELRVRDGLALRQYELPINRENTKEPAVQTMLDAESNASLNVRVTAKLSPFIDIDKTIPIFSNSSPVQRKQLSAVQYYKSDNRGFYDYRVGEVSRADPNAQVNACLQAAPASAPPVSTANPKDAIEQIGQAAIKEVHPCHVTLCSDSRTKQTCVWNGSKLVCTPTPVDRCCLSEVSLCSNEKDASGAELRLTDANGVEIRERYRSLATECRVQ